MTDIATAKDAMRREARLRRAMLATALHGASETLAQAGFDVLPISAGAMIAGYWPVGDEIDPLPLLRRLAKSHVCALPVVESGRALSFRAWAFDVPPAAGRYGIPSPPLDSPVVLPDILLVPLLAFDRTGHRLGYGGGHYDATLAALRAERPIYAVGLAYAGQEVARVPADARDQRLDAVLTEQGLIEMETTAL